MQDKDGGHTVFSAEGLPAGWIYWIFSLSFAIWISKYFLLVQSLKLRNSANL